MQIDEELITEFVNGNGVVFVGAGLSASAKPALPKWPELIASLRRRLGADCPEDVSYPQLAQYFVNAFGRPALVDWLRRELTPDGARPTPAATHAALLALPTNVIFTTNFDRLIEDAFGQRDPHRVVLDEHVSFVHPSVPQVVKVHGDLEYPDSIVFTSDDYNTFHVKKPAIARLLDHYLQTHTILFLGYSFSDYDLQMVLAHGDAATGGKRRQSFTLQWQPNALARAEFERQRIRVIDLHDVPDATDIGDAVRRWLAEFAQRVAARRAPQRQNHNLPPRTADLIGRDGDLDDVVHALETELPAVMIAGIQGVGKTRLALEVGHAHADRRTLSTPVGTTDTYTVWISAKDRPDADAGADWLIAVLDAVAKTTGWDAIARLPVEQFDKKLAQIEAVLRKHAVLVILDNYETIRDPRLSAWIDQVPAPSRVLLTTRSRDPGTLTRAVRLDIKGLRSRGAVDLLRRYAVQQGLSAVNAADEPTRIRLANATDGNPQAMWLAVGLLAGDPTLGLLRLVEELEGAGAAQNTDVLYDLLFARGWDRLSSFAQQTLLVTPLFVGVSSIQYGALWKVSNPALDEPAFNTVLAECERSGLLEPAPGTPPSAPRYTVHPATRAFARSKLDALGGERGADPSGFEQEARARFRAYLFDLVQRCVTRQKPNALYWNALVSDRMLEIDPEWPSIEDVLQRAERTADGATLIAWVLLLVHYMDSRFLNQQRLHYVRLAIAALREAGRPAEEALLRIDALGWTYVEEGRLDDALREIDAGLAVAGTVPDSDADQRRDLQALGFAWRARACLEQGDHAAATALIDRARAPKASPWINTRVFMAAGDIALKQNNFVGALELYTRQGQAAEAYDGEGRGYQVLPRIGLAHLGLADLADLGPYEIGAAEASFRELERAVRGLQGGGQLTIGGLYAEYGLALVAYQRGDTSRAARSMRDIRVKLSQNTKSNLLLKMIEGFEVTRGVHHA